MNMPKLNMKEMEDAAAPVTELMKVLSNRTRLLALCHLVDGERSVGELARFLGVREQAMSQQLALLRKDGLVTPRRDGQTIYYSLARGDIAEVMRFLHNTYCPVDQA